MPFHRLPDGQALHFPLDPIRTEPGAVFSMAQMWVLGDETVLGNSFTDGREGTTLSLV